MSFLLKREGAKKTKIAKVMRGSRFAFILLALLTAGCSDGPPASTQNPPAYPGVSKVEERTLGPEDRILNIYKSVTFTTPDAPEAVLVFYREQLVTDGWKVEEFQPDPQALLFRWESYEQPPAVYRMDVQARRTKSGATEVRIDLRDGVGN